MLVLSASCYSSFSVRLAKGTSCSSRRSPGSSHLLTTFVLPLFTLTAKPAIPPSGNSDESIHSLIVADGGCHVAFELFVGDHLLDRAYLQRGDGGPSTSRHDGSGEFLSAGDKLGAFLRRSLGERSTVKSPECGRSGPERPIIQSH